MNLPWITKKSVSARLLIVGTGLTLALFLTGLRILILKNELSDLSLLEGLVLVVRGSLQDWAFVLFIVLAALGSIWRLGATHGLSWRVVAFVAFSGLILLWGIANVSSVRLLGEPVTMSWILYSDIFNSTYILDSILHIFNLKLVLTAAAVTTVFVVISFLSAVLLEKWVEIGWKAFLAALTLMILLTSFGAGIGDGQIGRGKLSNPTIAFGLSFFSEGRLTPDFAETGDGSSVSFKQMLGRAKPSQRPDTESGQIRNVVLFILESTPTKYTQGFDGIYPTTPNLLKYSAVGRKFTNAYAHAPASNYFLVSAMAGIIPELSPFSMTYSYPNLRLESIADVLKARGFRTGFFNSADNRFQNTVGFVSHAGFDTVKDHRDWPCETGIYEATHASWKYLNTSNDLCTVKPVLEWIGRDPDRPFFLTFKTGMTHYPYYPGQNSQNYVADEYLNRYLNAIRVGDEAFGRVMDYLSEKNLLNSTLVVAVGDHGEAFGEHGSYVHAAALYEENIHVPLVLINPELFSGGSSDVIGGISDVAPTILDLLDIPAPKTWQGLSLFSQERYNGVLFFAPWKGFQIGFREGTKKYIYNAHSEQSWLFDLANDPNEQHNLAGEFPAEMERAKLIMAEWVTAQHEWVAYLLKGSGAEVPAASADTGPSELVIYATGTSFKSAPKARVRIDDKTIGYIEVTLAPVNAEMPVTETQIDAAVTKFKFSLEALDCAKRVEVFFLNDEWAGENLTGDTDLYIERIELDHRLYWPKHFTLGTARAGGAKDGYFKLWRKGGFWVELDVPPDCLARDLVSR